MKIPSLKDYIRIMKEDKELPQRTKTLFPPKKVKGGFTHPQGVFGIVTSFLWFGVIGENVEDLDKVAKTLHPKLSAISLTPTEKGRLDLICNAINEPFPSEEEIIAHFEKALPGLKVTYVNMVLPHALS